MKRGIAVLDHDLTLVNTLSYFFRSYNQARIKFGYQPISFKNFVNGYIDESLSNPPGTNRFDFWLFFSSIFKTFENEPVNPMPGAKELLKFLVDHGLEIIVVTGRRVEKSIIINELKKADLLNYISDVYTLHNLVLSKPFEKKRVISNIVNSYSSHLCISIGDYSEDVLSSNSNGCYSLGVAPLGKNPDLLYKAGAMFVGRDLREVKEYIEKNLI